MKATVKDTGKIINVVSYKGASEMWQNTENENELYHTLELEFPDSDMPSEKRMRYELAKAAMQGILSNLCGNIIREEIVKVAIKCADEMIKQLKESEVEK